jgi:hypothetical protein
MARARVARGESYVAGAAALNALTQAPRVSRDVDLFHDTTEAVEASWAASGKDPGFSPASILAQAGRSSLSTGPLHFHAGRILGAWPTVP